MAFIDPDEQQGFIDPDSDQARIKEGGEKQLKTLQGIGEGALSMVAPIPSSIAGGLYGLSKLMTGGSIEDANKAMEDTMRWNFGAGAYTPSSEGGQAVSEAIGKAFEYPGQKAGELVEKVTGSPEGYLYGRLPVDTAINLLPLKVPAALKGVMPKGSGTRMPKVEPKLGMEDVIKGEKRTETFVDPDTKPIPTEAQQELLPSNAPQYGIDHSNNAGHWVKDENGMPISAERSMDVQAATHPLQRDMFSEEWQPAQGAERTLPEAIDKMVQEAPDLPREGMDNRSYEISRALFNDEVPGNLTETRRTIQDQFQGEDLAAQEAMAKAADMDTLTFSAMNEGTKGRQRGAVDPDVFKEGFRGLNRWLSRLTDQPWVRERFPATMYESNADGTPRILLHGTMHGFNDQPRGVSYEGLHAGYATSATLKASHGNRRERTVSYRVGNLNFTQYWHRRRAGGEGAAIYPVVIRKGNYPRIPIDTGTWEPQKIARNRDFALELSKITRYGFHDMQEMLVDWADHNLNHASAADENAAFGRFLKARFNIDGFWYPNKFETAQRNLKAYAGNFQHPSNRSRALRYADALQETDSFVTYDDNNMRSLYDEPIRQVRTHSQSGVLNVGDIVDYFTGKLGKGGSQSSSMPKWKDLEVNPEFKLEDTPNVPRSQANIVAKKKKEAVSRITGVEKGVYGDIRTAEEARSNPGPDISNNVARDYVTPGVEGMIRTNSNNNILKFARTMMTGARNTAEAFSKHFVTGDKGLNSLYRKMNKNEWRDVAKALQIASREKTALTSEMMKQLGFSEAQSNFVNRLREALDEMFTMANDALTKNGFQELKYHGGYVPSMFSGAYTSLVGHYVTGSNGKRKFIVKGVAQGDTKAQHKLALEHYSKQGDKFAEVIHLPFKGLQDGSHRANRVFDGFNDLINIIAENDADFAEVKKLADDYANGKLKDLYNFKVHEKKKTGAKGALGDRPWLNADQNARDFLEGLINYLEDGSRYYGYQNALAEVGKLTRDEKLSVTHPNTLKYLERYINHVTGTSVSPLGQGSNWLINHAAKALGQSPKAWGKNINRAMSAMSAMMMGTINLPFFFTQLTQPFISGIPEGVALSKALNTSMTKSMMMLPGLVFENLTGKEMKHVPQHMRNAIKYAEDAGMMNFSEAELAHEVLQSPFERGLNTFAHWPSTVAERITRPPVFLTFADMFVQAGFPEDVAFRKAQYATDYAMVNYHPDERPMMYNTFGMMGRFMGALTTYKHNLGHGVVSRGMDVAKGKNIAPAIAAIGAMYLFYGISGIMGYDEADKMYQLVTGESIKHAVLGDDLVESDVWHGLLSAKTGIDFQSRLSMASALPDSPLAFMSPQASVGFDILSAAYNAAVNQDQASFQDLATSVTPVGMRGIAERTMHTDEQGYLLNKEGERKFDKPRSDFERKLRTGVGFKPLRERLESDDVYRRGREERKRNDTLANASKRFTIAVGIGDNAGAEKHMKDYIEAGGDIRQLLNNTKLKNWYINKYKSERERQQGDIKPNVNQINRYQGFQQ